MTASPVASRSSRAGDDLAGVDADPRLDARAPGSASRISAAARHARSASSSCATGTPNTAITASPMNFSTVPPCDSTIPLIRSKYRASSARNASGSVDSPSAVEPVTSQNSTVTVFRCSRPPPASGAAQKPQNWKPSGFSLPQAGQAATSRVYDESATGHE